MKIKALPCELGFFRFFFLMAMALTLSLSWAGESAVPSGDSRVKNGWPCVQEICVGDGITELKRVQWKKVVPDRNVSERYLSEIRKVHRASESVMKAALPYFWERHFDNAILETLEKIDGICDELENYQLLGEFKTASGLSTTVTVGLIVDDGSKKQRYRVLGIERQYPDGLTMSQLRELDAKVNLMYAPVLAQEQSAQTGPDIKATVRFFHGSQTSSTTLQLSWGPQRLADLQNIDMIRNLPMCRISTPSLD